MEKNVLKLSVEKIVPNPKNPRQDFPEEPMARLVNSIKTVGIKSPLLVQKLANGKYMLTDGERRLKAAKILEIKTVPVFVEETTDAKTRLITMFNLQEVQETWSPLDKAIALGELQAITSWDAGTMAKALGMSDSTVRQLLAINELSSKTVKRIKAIASSKTISKLAMALRNMAPDKRDNAEEAFVRSVELGKIKNAKDANKYIMAISKGKAPTIEKMKTKNYLADDALKESGEGIAWRERTMYGTCMATRSTARTFYKYLKDNPGEKEKLDDKTIEIINSTAVTLDKLRKAL